MRSLVSIGLTGLPWHGGSIPWEQPTLALLRGICGSIALLCFFEAITSLPLASATVLQYTYPTFTAGAAWLLLGERLRRRIGIAVVLGWIGVVMVIQPEWLGAGQVGLAMQPAMTALGGALFTALAYVCVRRLSTKEHPLVIILYFPLVSIPLTLPMVIQNGVWPWDWTGLVWSRCLDPTRPDLGHQRAELSGGGQGDIVELRAGVVCSELGLDLVRRNDHRIHLCWRSAGARCIFHQPLQPSGLINSQASRGGKAANAGRCHHHW